MQNSTIVAAFILDLALGDPEWLPHPVRWMGRGITLSEGFWRGRVASEFWAGAAMVLTLLAFVWLAASAFLWVLAWMGGFFHWMGCVLLIYYCISAQSLAGEARGVFHAVDPENMASARKRLSRIVGRDTARLDDEGVVRATVETVSENFVDGVLSPLFFALLGGAPAALTYKAVNTLDSMVGYKNARYRRFGTFAARLDDLANYIPARISLVPIFLSALLADKSPLRVLEIRFRDGRKHASPNAGIPEAAFSGALDIRLGGPSYYAGALVEKPYIGEESAPPRKEKIKEAVFLMLLASSITVLGCVAVGFIF